ncbi:MAG: methyltransferase domain-containing protein [Candidatus Omnitrophica bacterium]|nr:methyltransferase domain-containing protein [Candidatus Omnitrophota bacterium]
MKTENHNSIQRTYWDSVASKNKVITDCKLAFPAIRERDLFFKFAAFKKGDTILEIGCGTGKYTIGLLRMGCKVCATDISGESLRVLKKTAEEEGFDKNLTLEETAFDDTESCRRFFDKFDYVLFVAVIHHLDPEKRPTIFKNVVNSVKRGGTVVALEPNAFNPLYYCMYFWRALARVKAERWHTEKGLLGTTMPSLKTEFKNWGLKNIRTARYAWLPSKFAGNCPAVFGINDTLNRIPILKEMSAFIWIRGDRC